LAPGLAHALVLQLAPRGPHAVDELADDDLPAEVERDTLESQPF
jgi:hypothetical protein